MEQNNKEAIIRIEGDIKLIHQKIDTLKDNHLYHVEKDIRQLKTFIWFIGTTVFLQMCYLIVRSLI
jgi:hypothetical protein|tara:strand:+ start:623 stop:820 length:198 start_codon:yes stop_codon:yes gene_type:complete